jgi:hypothetical protein
MQRVVMPTADITANEADPTLGNNTSTSTPVVVAVIDAVDDGPVTVASATTPTVTLNMCWQTPRYSWKHLQQVVLTVMISSQHSFQAYGQLMLCKVQLVRCKLCKACKCAL